MLKAIIYKEWLKTRGVFLIGLLLSVCMAGFEILSMNRVGTVKGVEHIWQIMLMKDNMFVNHLTFIPLAVGVGVGLAQMLPEMVQKRFKLTLHLPYSQNRMVLAMLAVGLAEIVAVSVVTSVIVVVYDMRILAPELVAYFFTAAVCIEGCRVQKVALSLLGVGVVSWLFAGDAPEAYNGVLLLFVVASLSCALLVYRSVYRFKEGLQD